MKIKILALVLMLGIVGRVDAGYYTAGIILSDCESESEIRQQSCLSYLASVYDTTQVWDGWVQLPKYFCVPGKVTLAQLIKIYIKYANENPELWHQTASGTVLNAFSRAFPCE